MAESSLVMVDPAYAVNGTAEEEPGEYQRWPSQDDEYLCDCAREHFALSDEYESEWRERALDDQRFAHGEQWHPALLQARKDRQCLVIDRSGTPLRSIVNEGRMNRLGIVVSPMGNGATMDTAKTIKGLIRNIENQSFADIAYTTARMNAVTMGRGYVRVLPAYVDDFSFDQELRILPIRNMFSVRLDPHHTMPDASDINWAFVVERLSRTIYEQTYGDLPAESAAWAGSGDSWIGTDEVQVAEYYWREWHSLDLVQLDDGQIKPVSRLEEGEREMIVERRTAKVPQVWWAKINGYQILGNKTRWQGRYIPIAQQIGECWDIEGRADYQGLTRRLKDPQRQYNFFESAKAEAIALAPKAPFIGAAAQFEGYQQFWQSANTVPHAYLPYHPVVIGGQVLPPPQRNTAEAPVQALTQGAIQAADEIKAISGYHDPALGDTSPDQSGVAIGKRQAATNVASYHFGDNERWMIRHVGRILVDAIPFYYSGPRTERIIGDDERGRQVQLNQEHVDPDTGKPVLYDVTVGRYDVSIDAGPSFQTKRQEAVDKLSGVIAAVPQLMQIFGDDYVQSIDFDLAEHAAERIRKSMPPALLDGEPGAEKYRAAQEQLQQLQQLPMLQQQVQQQQKQLMQLNEAIQSLSQTNNQMQLELANKQREQELQMRKMEIEQSDKDRQRILEEKKLEIDAYKAESERLKVTASTADQDVQGGPYGQ